MSTYISAPLNTINQYEQSVAKYEQQSCIRLRDQQQEFVTQFENQFSQVQTSSLNVSSATLPQSSNLESLLLSRNAGNVAVFRPVPVRLRSVMQQNAASAAVRTMTDMTDAQSQDAMKRAIEIDALAMRNSRKRTRWASRSRPRRRQRADSRS